MDQQSVGHPRRGADVVAAASPRRRPPALLDPGNETEAQTGGRPFAGGLRKDVDEIEITRSKRRPRTDDRRRSVEPASPRLSRSAPLFIDPSGFAEIAR